VGLAFNNSFLFPAPEVELVLLLGEVADWQPERSLQRGVPLVQVREHQRFECGAYSSIASRILSLVVGHLNLLPSRVAGEK